MRWKFRSSRRQNLGFGRGLGRRMRVDGRRRWQNPFPRRRHRIGGNRGSWKKGKENITRPKPRQLPAAKGLIPYYVVCIV